MRFMPAKHFCALMLRTNITKAPARRGGLPLARRLRLVSGPCRLFAWCINFAVNLGANDMAEYEGTVEELLPMLAASITQLRVVQEANRLITLALLAQLSRLRGVSLQKLSRDVTNSAL